MAKIDSGTFYSKNFKLHGDILKAEKQEKNFTNKDGKPVQSQYLEIRILDDDAESVLTLIDKDVSHLEDYPRKATGTFTLRIDFSPEFATAKYTCTMYVVGFEPDEGEG